MNNYNQDSFKKMSVYYSELLEHVVCIIKLSVNTINGTIGNS